MLILSNAALTAESAYDILDRMTNLVYRNASGAVVGAFAYRRDVLGLVTQKVGTVNGVTAADAYTYDALGRLTSANGVAYTYDLAGNRLTSGADTFTYTHNRLDGVRHDTAGNVTNIVRGGVTLALSWNTQGQLLSIATNGAFAESYTYDPLGRRVSTTDGSGTVIHVYDGAQCVVDVSANGALLRSYTWGEGIDNLLAVTVYSAGATNSYYAVKDHLNSVCALVDTAGAVVESYAFDAWGNVQAAAQSAIGNRYLWQGREYSQATGLYNFRARWYDPTIGRWLSKDPIGLEGGLNLYAFCGNDPVNFVDPFGLCKTVMDGNMVQRDQLNFLMWPPGNQYNPRHIMETFFNLNPDPKYHFDLRENYNANSIVYSYNGQIITPDVQGNINAGYVSFMAYGPLGCAFICIGGEMSYFTTTDAMAGSFRANLQGAVDAVKHVAVNYAIGVAVDAIISVILP